MSYYAKALEKDPQNNVARAYLGEAHLSHDDLAAASQLLRRIESSCGRGCEPYVELAGRIDKYRSPHGKRR